METMELVIRGEDPPRRKEEWRGCPAVRLLVKVLLFIAIIVTIPSVYLPPMTPGIRYLPPALQYLTAGLQKKEAKEEAIAEILTILEKQQTGLADVTRRELAEVIYEEAQKYNYDPKFILALISIESSFQNWSVSERGAKGMMQIMPYVAESVAKQMGIEWGGDSTLFNPYLNIRLGVHYLSQLVTDFEDLGLAMAAYNFGPTYVKEQLQKKKKVPLHFYKKVLDTKDTL
jgi:soluble lytic murein transglycosylase-like protein